MIWDKALREATELHSFAVVRILLKNRTRSLCMWLACFTESQNVSMKRETYVKVKGISELMDAAAFPSVMRPRPQRQERYPCNS